MRAAILALGDEIVSGTTLDTNSAFLAGALRENGVEVVAILAAPDEETAIARAVERGLEEAELVVSTGGLGPTADDLTTACVARLAGLPLVLHEPSLAHIEERFRSRGIEFTPNNRRQALFPEGSVVVPNPIGTAPGFICPFPVAGEVRHLVCLPGVPWEMRLMVEETLLPWVRGRAGGLHFASRVFSTFGLPESRLDELLAGVLDPAEGRLAFRAAFPRVQARITLPGADPAALQRRLDALEVEVRQRLGGHLYATGDLGMEEVVGQLLRDHGLTVAVAESCTGGLIGHRITDVPGSSEYFLLGVVAYANAAKEALLGVSGELLERHGAVSEETAAAMAEGVRQRAGADIGVATTGIAGPGGGTEEKPVGTVCVALAWEGGRWSRRYRLGTRGREWIKEMTAQIALDRLRRHVLSLEETEYPYPSSRRTPGSSSTQSGP
jgi:nicotinamide-nucleotide amidase